MYYRRGGYTILQDLKISKYEIDKDNDEEKVSAT